MNNASQIVSEFWTRLADSPVLMVGLSSQPAHSEPLIAELDRAHPDTLFFFTRADNRLVEGLDEGRSVALAQFVSRGHDFFASLKGRLSPVNDDQLIDRLWSAEAAAWFDGGRKDPMVRLLRLDTEHVELWKVDVSLGNRIKRFFGGAPSSQAVEQGHVKASL